MRKSVLAGLALVPLLLMGGGVAFAQSPTPTPTPTTAAPTTTPAPSVIPDGQVPIAQICAATGIAQVDDLLADVSNSALAGQLKPLVGLVVPKADTLTVVSAVQLDDIKKKLNCGDAPAPTTTPTTTAPPAGGEKTCTQLRAEGTPGPFVMGDPLYTAARDSDSDGVACEGNDFPAGSSGSSRAETGGVDTGDGSYL
jgi:hypothetical protein